MSVPSNITNWKPSVPPDQSVYEESTSQKAPLGVEITVGDRTFRYAQAGANLSAGDAVATPVSTAVVKATANAAVAVGATAVNIYAAADQTADALAGGYLVHVDSGNQGYMYKIRTHAALTATTAGQTVYLYDGVAEAITTADKITVVPNVYKSVTNVITSTTPIPGVAPVDVTSGNYFWLQTEGPGAVKIASGAAGYGVNLVPSTTGGCAAVDATANSNVIAVVIGSGATAADHAVALIKCNDR